MNAVNHFSSTEWCAKLRADPNYTAIDIPRRVADSDSEETFMTQTLRTDRTVRATLSLYKAPTHGESSTSDINVGEVCTLKSLGPGLRGQIGMCYGCFVAVLLDDIMS